MFQTEVIFQPTAVIAAAFELCGDSKGNFSSFSDGFSRSFSDFQDVNLFFGAPEEIGSQLLRGIGNHQPTWHRKAEDFHLHSKCNYSMTMKHR